MTWIHRYRFRRALHAIWPAPSLLMLLALAGAPAMRRLDQNLGWRLLGFTSQGATSLLQALVGSTLAFLVFMFTILLVAIQFASAMLTPRLVAMTLNDRYIKVALGVFVFTFCWSLALLARVDVVVPQVCMLIAVLSTCASIIAFLLLLDHVGYTLRPSTLIAETVSRGRKVLEEVYPDGLSMPEKPGTRAPLTGSDVTVLYKSGPSGVFLAMDIPGLAELGKSLNCTIELLPQVGDFVAHGEPLVRIHGARCPTDRDLRDRMAFGPERTLQQDPTFAFRIIVDVAVKALSPAINDPTTAVIAIDQLHRLLASVGSRRLDTGDVPDSSGDVRLRFRTPNWNDFVTLAVTEIRQFGANSVQVMRRLNAMLDSLAGVLPSERLDAINVERQVIRRMIGREFIDAEDRAKATTPDTQGLGGATE